MKKSIFEKLKGAKTNEEAAAMIRELSPEDLANVSGGAEEANERETINWMLERGMYDVAWNYLQEAHGVTDSEKERYIKTYGYEGGVRYVVEKVLHLS